MSEPTPATEKTWSDIADDEQRLQQLVEENERYQALIAQQRQELDHLQAMLLAEKAQLARFEGSVGWLLVQKLQSWRASLLPPGSVRDQAFDDAIRALRTRRWRGLIEAGQQVGQEVTRQVNTRLWRYWLHLRPPRQGQVVHIDELRSRPPVQPHQSTVDIIICVHNALPDVQVCLASLQEHTLPPYHLILVDDGSDPLTRDFLIHFTRTNPGVTRLRNETPQGYTRAANQGLAQTTADYIVLLNSDTLVTPGWLDRLVACAESDSHIGLVGPLSNTASWQSIPEVDQAGDWAVNLLPRGVTVEEMARLVAHYSARLYPSMPFLNGFCLMIKRPVLDQLGLFDEENFGAGYGEENDYVLTARKAGWRPALADDAYVFHAQSRSYSHDRRKALSERAGILLAQKHGAGVVHQGLAVCRHDRVLEGIRARSQVMVARQELLSQGQTRFAGKRVLFVLPILGPGGGANVVINEAMTMAKMGAEVTLFNLASHREIFEQSYPQLSLPVRYGPKEDLAVWATQYDAIVATANWAVEWLATITSQPQRPVLGYYVQEFEPYIYPPGSADYERAEASYTLIPDLVRFTKTDWTRQEVKTQTGADCREVGVSLDIDLFRPRPRSGPDWPDRPLNIVAMVRPRPPYRNARLTMEVLRHIARQYGSKVAIIIFGISLENPEFSDLPHDFAWNLAGILTQTQVAHLLNEADIFVDFSSHQAMGLTALEAMACGSAVVVPARGGAASFARCEENSLVVDTASAEACRAAVSRLIEDDDLRLKLQRQALRDVCEFYLERAAFNILSTLFEPTESL